MYTLYISVISVTHFTYTLSASAFFSGSFMLLQNLSLEALKCESQLIVIRVSVLQLIGFKVLNIQEQHLFLLVSFLGCIHFN